MLTSDEKGLLEAVLEHTGDMETMIAEGVTKALRGVNDKARRTYLWNILSTAAKQRIRRAQQKVRRDRLAGI